MRTGVLLLAAFCGLPAVGAAQEPQKAGIVMGYPASIGVLWHVSKRVAVRPEFSFTRTSNEFTSALGTTASTTAATFGAGASGIFYLTGREKLRTYLSPRYSYARLTTGADDSAAVSTDGAGHTHSLTGSFGAEYGLSNRFSVFGEAGLGYNSQKTSSALGPARSASVTHSWGTRTAVGVVLYF
jgi:opacity protein-like surface antigen